MNYSQFRRVTKMLDQSSLSGVNNNDHGTNHFFISSSAKSRWLPRENTDMEMRRKNGRVG